MKVLALNAGSSSIKAALFDSGPDGERELGRWSVQTGREDAKGVERAPFDLVAESGLPPPDAVGHRLVHGGPERFDPVRVDAGIREELSRAVRFAPLHLPEELELLDGAMRRFPKIPHVACFDTGFHEHLPEVARRLPLPRRAYEAGIRRYGFHGLSYEYVASTLGGELGRGVIAHLGSGSSLAAVQGGRSVDTTMGFTPAGGVMMATRPGDLDPGAVLEMAARFGMDADGLTKVIHRESGLVGVSETTGDMKALLAAEASDARARLAVDMFCLSVRKAIGALAAVLGGMDALVFTGGIGERSPEVRSRVSAGLEHLGVRIDPARQEGRVDLRNSWCRVYVVRTDEERMIARHVRSIVG